MSIHQLKKLNVLAVMFLLVMGARAQDPVNPTPPDDLATSIKKIMQFALTDYAAIKETQQSQFFKFASEKFWMSKYKVDGFTNNRIKMTITDRQFFSTNYFQGKDTSAALIKFRELIQKVKDCLPQTCCAYAESMPDNMKDLKRYEFWSGKLNPGFEKAYEKLYIYVNYIVEADTKDAVVSLCIAQKE